MVLDPIPGECCVRLEPLRSLTRASAKPANDWLNVGRTLALVVEFPNDLLRDWDRSLVKNPTSLHDSPRSESAAKHLPGRGDTCFRACDVLVDRGAAHADRAHHDTGSRNWDPAAEDNVPPVGVRMQTE